MPEQIQKSWERLEKRVIKFNENFPEAHVICFAVVDNFYRSAGNQQMKVHFVETDVVKTKYREIIEGQSVINQNEPREEVAAEQAELHDSLKDSLAQHCFDMDMNEIRAIITTVLSPPDKPLGTGRMRGFYQEANCPSWWRETSVPFASLNNPRAGQKRATIEDGYKLIESLQEFCQVYPPRPIKMPNSSIQFRSRFYCEAQSSSSDCSVPVNVSATLTSVSSTTSSTSTSASSTTTTPSTITSSTPTTDTSTSAMPAHATSNTATSTPVTPNPDTSNSPTPTHATYYTATPIPATSTTSMPTSAMPGSATATSNTSNSATPNPVTPNPDTSNSPTPTHATYYTATPIPATSTSSMPTSAMPGPATCNSATPTCNISTSATSYTASPIPATSTSSLPTSSMPGPATCNSATATSNTSTSATSNLATSYTATPTPVTSTSATPTPATSNTAHSLRQRREQLISLSKEPMKKENSIALLKILGAGNWNELVALSEELKAFIPAFPISLAKKWERPTLISTNKRYKDFIPDSIGKRTVISASSDGNCIYNAFSIALYGNEDEAFFLRLASVVTVADNILQYSKYMVEEFGNDVTYLISSLSGTEYTVPENLSDGERIEYFCMQELLLTARMPFRDCTLFHMHILSNLLQRAVVSHY
ncbi:serine-rich adhesin for platelets-like isoform X2 [Mytilus californianus]|uniref:serine-rich adhesin for platelets-like isoform X2 n=1 Tax=Mytilus californianus TaxID=6549 RepID=UPI0022486C9C|nr:serine-rich adhesin for platelets-like isoform X2 [Mytilus californianus]XP_052071569.1 serine-rich adhesin for platelets-like isoform X2 [Mytilus californianus]